MTTPRQFADGLNALHKLGRSNMTELRTQGKNQTADGSILHMVRGGDGELLLATPEMMATTFEQIEQDDILFVYRNGKEY